MSYVFDIADRTVWSPALKVGKLYIEMVASVARILGRPSGVHAIANDYYDIDLAQFQAFVDAMAIEYAESNHDIYRHLLGVILPISVALIFEVEPMWRPTVRLEDILDQAHDFSQKMPR
ncbi:hypothetical protein FAF44_46585 [Nonomuraea sp. MG754425]|uniref:DUF6086 family protein n=1 Tax=Nonomuraea sp. MG754425 TaxID=2570319 RepID=UPI001F1B7AE4|nr:DUF6086 family protein [Nonomuraea sp. MG754425]MCF6475761.1 hypothetical protein [Nonomuraea sp. MG754425]